MSARKVRVKIVKFPSAQKANFHMVKLKISKLITYSDTETDSTLRPTGRAVADGK